MKGGDSCVRCVSVAVRRAAGVLHRRRHPRRVGLPRQQRDHEVNKKSVYIWRVPFLGIHAFLFITA